MWRPMASSGWYPKSRVAAGFQADTFSPRSIVTMATGLISTSASKYCFWRRISAAASVWSVMSIMNPWMNCGLPSASRTIQLSSRTQTVLPSAWMIRYSYVDLLGRPIEVRVDVVDDAIAVVGMNDRVEEPFLLPRLDG